MSDDVKAEEVTVTEKPPIEEVAKQILKEKYGVEEYDQIEKGRRIDFVKDLRDAGYDVKEISEYLKIPAPTIGRMIVQAEKREEERRRKEEIAEVIELRDEDLAVEHPYPEIPTKIKYRGYEYTPHELVSEFGKEGLDQIKIHTLRNILMSSPAKSIGQKIIDKIIRRVALHPVYRDNPAELQKLLMEYRVPRTVISEVLEIMNYIDQTFRPLIRPAMIPTPPMPNPQPEYYMPPPAPQYYEPNYYQPQYNYNPYSYPNWSQAYPQPQYPYPHQRKPLTEEDVVRIVKETIKELEEEKKKKDIEEEIKDIYTMLRHLYDKIEKLEKGESEEEKKQNPLDEIKAKISALEARIAAFATNPPKDEEKNPLLNLYKEELNALREEVRNLRDALSRQQISQLMDRLKTIEERLNSPPFQGSSLIDDRYIRVLELSTEEEKERIRANAIRDAAKQLKETVQEAVRTFGRGVGSSIFANVLQQPYENVVKTSDKYIIVCPKCGTEFEAPLDARIVECPGCKTRLEIREEGKEKKEEKKKSKSKKKEEGNK